MDLTKYKIWFYNHFRRLQMNTIFERMELGNQHLEQLHTEAQTLRLIREAATSNRVSMRHRLARFLRQIARHLEPNELQLGRA
jgi:hypothetical protein